MNCDKFMQIIDAYFDGELDSQTSNEFVAHQQSCNDCNLLFTSYEDMLNSLKDLRQEDIPFPEGLHENIMKSVNAVAKATSETNIIDITNHIENNEQSASGLQVVSDPQTTKESYFTKRRVNILVAGFLTLFISTGAYTTYDRLQNPVTATEPLLNIDYDALQSETAAAEESPVAEEEIQLFSAETQESANTEIADEQTVETDSVAIAQDTTATAGTSENTTIAASSIDPNTSVSSENTEKSVTEPKVAVPDSAPAAATLSATAMPTSGVAAPQTRKISPEILDDLVISINNNNSELLKTYVDYLAACPDITVNDIIINNNNEYYLTATSSNFENFKFYAENFTGYEKGTLNFSYSEETLAKIKELQEFKIKLVKN